MDFNTDQYLAMPTPDFLLPPNPPQTRRSLSLSSVDSMIEAYSTLVPPQAPPADVITSLISSLSTISVQAEPRFIAIPDVEERPFGFCSSVHARPPTTLAIDTNKPTHNTAQPSSPSSPNWRGNEFSDFLSTLEQGQQLPGSDDDNDDDDDDDDDGAAAPPVIRFSKSQTATSDQRLWWAKNRSPSKLHLRKSIQGLVSQADKTGTEFMGDWPASPTSSHDVTSPTENSQTGRTKRVATSTSAGEKGPGRGLETGILTGGPRSRTSMGKISHLRISRSERNLWEYRIDKTNIDIESPRLKSSGSSQGPGHSSISGYSPGADSPSWITALRQEPSHSSSLRHSFSDSPQGSISRSSVTEYSSSGSKDFRSDWGTFEEEDQTVRRIRELHEAKDLREQKLRGETRTTYGPTSQTYMPKTILPPRTTYRQSSGFPEGETLAEEGNRNLMGRDGTALKSTTSQTLSSTGSTGKPTTASTFTTMNPARDDDTASRPTMAQGPRSTGNKLMTEPASGFVALATVSSSNWPPGSATSSQMFTGGLKAIDVQHPQPTSPSAHPLSARVVPDSGRPKTADSIDQAVDSYIRSPRLTQKIQHPQTGRKIAFSEVGDPNGFAVICCVGMGLTRFLTAFYDELAKTMKLRLITPDRPGVGESELCVDGRGTPLSWPDDVSLICSHLGITKFSLLAHSAGTIYALAIALRMPQFVRGRIHLLAPWIPPSQMSMSGNSTKESLPTANLPYLQKFLRVLPTSFLKAANASFLSENPAGITPASKHGRSRRNGIDIDTVGPHLATIDGVAGSRVSGFASKTASPSLDDLLESMHKKEAQVADFRTKSQMRASPHAMRKAHSTMDLSSAGAAAAADRASASYDERLTHSIWSLATKNANPSVDLLTCLERRQTIGFRYVDISRAVVMHHGSRDTRVPVDNVKWLGKMMPRCEVRILEGEGHGLMAKAKVMGSILGEIAKEWNDRYVVTQGKKTKREFTVDANGVRVTA